MTVLDENSGDQVAGVVYTEEEYVCASPVKHDAHDIEIQQPGDQPSLMKKCPGRTEDDPDW